MRPFSCAVCALNACENSMMLTPCWPSAGPTGGAGFACPPGICSLMSVRTFLAMSVQLLHLVERQLHRNLALENVDEHLQLLLVRIDVDDLAVEVGERAGGYLHRLAERELDLRARPLAVAATGVQDPVDLALRQRHRLGARPNEPGHARRVLDDRPRFVRHVHVHEHVARQHALLRLDLLAFLRLDHLLGRDDDATEARCLVHGHDPVLEIGLHLVLVPGVGVDHIPAEHGYFTKTCSTRRLNTRSEPYRKTPTIRQAISTTTTPWISWFWPGHSTFFSSPHDSATKRLKPLPGMWRSPTSARGGAGLEAGWTRPRWSATSPPPSP